MLQNINNLTLFKNNKKKRERKKKKGCEKEAACRQSGTLNSDGPFTNVTLVKSCY